MSALVTTLSPALVTNERGGPVPSPSIMAELKKLDAALGLRWIANLDNSEWAVTWEWRQNDPRWARVRSQEITRESAYDILGYLPAGCSVDEAKGYIESHLKNYPKEEISRLRAKMTRWNEVELPNEQVKDVVTGALDDLAREKRAPKGQKVFHS